MPIYLGKKEVQPKIVPKNSPMFFEENSNPKKIKIVLLFSSSFLPQVSLKK
jgi:hypothetical protein